MTLSLVDAPGGNLLVIEEGSGPPILLLHARGQPFLERDGSATEDIAILRVTDPLCRGRVGRFGVTELLARVRALLRARLCQPDPAQAGGSRPERAARGLIVAEPGVGYRIAEP